MLWVWFEGATYFATYPRKLPKMTEKKPEEKYFLTCIRRSRGLYYTPHVRLHVPKLSGLAPLTKSLGPFFFSSRFVFNGLIGVMVLTANHMAI